MLIKKIFFIPLKFEYIKLWSSNIRKFRGWYFTEVRHMSYSMIVLYFLVYSLYRHPVENPYLLLGTIREEIL